MFIRRKATAESIRFRPRIVVAAAALLAAACTSAPVAAPPAPTLDRFYQQQLTWGPCTDYEGGADLVKASMDCARVVVPIDYADPDGDTARIALSRLRARGTKVASLLTNPGGPGVPGLEMPLALADTPLAQHFDMIGMDVRGLGASMPRLSCRGNEQLAIERQLLGFSNAWGEIDQIEEENEDYAGSCVQQSGIDLLAHVGTVDVARDIDVVRAALGDDKLTYFGVSYGTRLGSTYAELFPARVRAMVLDGAIDPARNIDDPVIDGAAFQQAFDGYAADCAKTPTCPLGTDPNRTTEAFRKLVQPLLDRPASADAGKLSYNDVLSLVISGLYHPRFWPQVTEVLAAVASGGTFTPEDAFQPGGDNGDYVHKAVLCLEDRRVTDRATATELERRYRAAGPIFDTGDLPDQIPLDTCAFWPVPPSTQPHQFHAPGLPKTVVVVTTGDPATEYQGGVNLAKAMGASLITYEGFQHGATFDGVSCVDDPVVKYLTDLVAPPDTRCAKPAESAAPTPTATAQPTPSATPSATPTTTRPPTG
ncbi:alpha/beta hydrolase [Nocardia sp. NPDC050712]|uniref:alpha/beta hydrolase n=1 Tax=Nocardia sp. NPDC050712 TaxID=3155518 RepID=UPI003409810F